MSWVKLRNKYATKCVECETEIEVDEDVWWMKGTGVKHVNCEVSRLDPIPLEQWFDQKEYTYLQLQTMYQCQCCGTELDMASHDSYLADSRKICEKCWQR